MTLRSRLASERNLRLRPSYTQHGHRHLRLLAEQLRGEALRLEEDAVIVDLGCGAMPYRELFSGDYFGLDMVAMHGVPHALATAENTPLSSECADVVISTQQLEHVDDPKLVLAEAKRLLQPGGTLLLSTHGVWPYHPDPHDRWRWTEEGLRKTVSDAGLRVERIHRQGEFPTAALLMASYPVGGARRKGGRPIRMAAGVVLIAVNLLCEALDAIAAATRIRHYASSGYLVVAVKPVADGD